MEKRELAVFSALVVSSVYMENRYAISYTETGARQILNEKLGDCFFRLHKEENMELSRLALMLTTANGREGYFVDHRGKRFIAFQSREDKIYTLL